MNFYFSGRKAFSLFTFLFLWLFGAVSSGFAGHLAGSELSTSASAAGAVTVNYKVYYDCAGPIPADSVLVNLKAIGCNADTTFFLRRNSFGTLSNPYCVTAGNPCNSTTAPNVRTAFYSVTKPLSAAQLQCNEWQISVKDCGRYPVANLQNANNGCIYSETYLNLMGGNSLVTSPVFNSNPSIFATTYSLASVSNLAKGQLPKDSLVYTLKPALADTNSPYVYTGSATFGSPIPSSSGTSLHPLTGMLTFTPNMFMPPTGPGANTHAVVVEVAAYRKINGAMVKVSTSLRNLPVFVVDNNPNENPEIINVFANGQLITPNTIIEVPVNSIFRLEFNTHDPNPTDNLEIIVQDFLVAGYNFTLQTGNRPAGTITGTGGATADSVVRYYPVTVRDNNCPVRGTVTHIYGIKTVARVTGIKNGQTEVNLFRAVPNPFTDQVAFNFASEAKPQTIIIYNLLGQEIDRMAVKTSGEINRKTVWKNAAKQPAGTYLAKLLTSDKMIQTIRFTKLQ